MASNHLPTKSTKNVLDLKTNRTSIGANVILSIDPGINFCGLIVSDFTDHLVVKHSHLVKNIRKLTEEEKVLEKVRGIRVVKISAILSKVN